MKTGTGVDVAVIGTQLVADVPVHVVTVEGQRYTIHRFVDAGNTCTIAERTQAGIVGRRATAVVHTETLQVIGIQNIKRKVRL